MEETKQIFCRLDMVCDNPKGGGVEIVRMPEFFDRKPPLETSLTHVHTFYEIVWFQQGTGVHTVDFSDYPVSDGTVFFIAPGQVHSFDGTRGQRGYVMKVCSHLLTESAPDDETLLKYNLFRTYDSAPFRKITPDCAAAVQGIVDMLERESSLTGTLGHMDYLRSLVTMLLIQVERCQSPDRDPIFSPGSTPHRVFLEFRRQIEHNYRSMHTVKEYASLLGVGTKTLTNYVGACSPFSPLEMIDNRIVLEARRMLRYSDMLVKEIAATLGFEDASYFNKFFRRHAGASAAEYRAMG